MYSNNNKIMFDWLFIRIYYVLYCIYIWALLIIQFIFCWWCLVFVLIKYCEPVMGLFVYTCGAHMWARASWMCRSNKSKFELALYCVIVKVPAGSCIILTYASMYDDGIEKLVYAYAFYVYSSTVNIPYISIICTYNSTLFIWQWCSNKFDIFFKLNWNILFGNVSWAFVNL